MAQDLTKCHWVCAAAGMSERGCAPARGGRARPLAGPPGPLRNARGAEGQQNGEQASRARVSSAPATARGRPREPRETAERARTDWICKGLCVPPTLSPRGFRAGTGRFPSLSLPELTSASPCAARAPPRRDSPRGSGPRWQSSPPHPTPSPGGRQVQTDAGPRRGQTIPRGKGRWGVSGLRPHTALGGGGVCARGPVGRWCLRQPGGSEKTR